MSPFWREYWRAHQTRQILLFSKVSAITGQFVLFYFCAACFLFVVAVWLSVSVPISRAYLKDLSANWPKLNVVSWTSKNRCWTRVWRHLGYEVCGDDCSYGELSVTSFEQKFAPHPRKVVAVRCRGLRVALDDFPRVNNASVCIPSGATSICLIHTRSVIR